MVSLRKCEKLIAARTLNPVVRATDSGVAGIGRRDAFAVGIGQDAVVTERAALVPAARARAARRTSRMLSNDTRSTASANVHQRISRSSWAFTFRLNRIRNQATRTGSPRATNVESPT